MHPLTAMIVSQNKTDRVAQLVEHLPFKERVLGSSPSPVTKKVKRYCLTFFIFVHFKKKAHVAELVDALA